jgi:hypothetical protein
MAFLAEMKEAKTNFTCSDKEFMHSALGMMDVVIVGRAKPVFWEMLVCS